MSTLRDHKEMIDLNPLVTDRFRSPAPAYALAEESAATWYTIIDRIPFLPGVPAASSLVTYYGCFHDLPTGLQTHVYAPMGLEIRSRWQLGGCLPGEPREAVELGLGLPQQGLWLREDVELRCNFVMMSFVKKTIRKAHAVLVNRLVEKAGHTERRRRTESDLGKARPAGAAARVGMGRGHGLHWRASLNKSLPVTPAHSPALSGDATFAGAGSGSASQQQQQQPRQQIGPAYAAYQPPPAAIQTHQRYPSQGQQPQVHELTAGTPTRGPAELPS
jgi:hypothetical protein